MSGGEIFYIHPPSSGGTWLRRELTRCFGEGSPWTTTIGHRSVREMVAGGGDDRLYHPRRLWHNPKDGSEREKLTKRYHRATKIATVRNPFSYLFSIWAKNGGKGIGMQAELHGIDSFEQWVEAWCNPDFDWHSPIEIRHKYIHQNLFHQLFYHDGSCGVDIILRQENLCEAMIEWLMSPAFEWKTWKDRARDWGEIIDPTHTNNGQFPDYRAHYTDKLRRMVESRFKTELQVFGYNFDGITPEAKLKDQGFAISPDRLWGELFVRSDVVISPLKAEENSGFVKSIRGANH